MRGWALLLCAGAACATTTPSRTEVDMPNRPPPGRRPPPPMSAQPQADEIIKAQLKSYGKVTEAFDPVNADLLSGDDRTVAVALEVVEAIGTRIDEMAKKCPPDEGFDGLLCGLSNLDSLVLDIDNILILLRRKGGCATVVAVERAAKQFDRLPRFQRNPKAELDASLLPQVPPDNSLPIRVFVCGMSSLKDKVSACFTKYQVPGTVMVNVVIGPDGTVTSAVATGSFAGTPTGTCVETAARTATFPSSAGRSSPYPFVLKPTTPASAKP